MSGLLPSTPDTSAADEPDPRVIGLDSDDASDLLAALSAGTARDLLAALHDEPATPSALAQRVDTSLQNAQYHLRKLEDADLIEVIDTCYSAKGREMSVYAPADRPLVVFAGREDQALGLRTALSRLIGGVGVLGLASLFIEQLVGDGIGAPTVGFGDDDAARDEATPADDADAVADADDAPEAATPEEEMDVAADPTPAETPAPEATPEPEAAYQLAEATDAAAGLPPGLLFFLGGLTVLLCVFGVWYYRANYA